MAKGKNNVFFCQECGYESSKWVGQCPACKAWNTMVEEIVDKKSSVTHRQITEVQVAKLNDVQSSSEKRMDTHIEELNRVLGGGIVPGSLVLVGGDPGIGKSTLLLQTCKSLSDQKIAVLYISGEESLQQIKMRADRIGIFSDEMTLLCETNLDLIQGVIEERKPQVVVIDSIQTMFRENVNSAPGSVSQVREATSVLMRLAKEQGIAIFVVGHVTKEGTVAGPRVLEHMVDTVLYFEGDRYASYRILRAVKTDSVLRTRSVSLKCASQDCGKFPIRQNICWMANPRMPVVRSLYVPWKVQDLCWWRYRRWYATVRLVCQDERRRAWITTASTF